MPENPIGQAVSAHGNAVRISCKVQPRASRCAVAGLCGNALKIALTAPPVDGKANAALCAFLAEKCDCPKSAVSIVLGMTSRNKTVEIAGLTVQQVIEALSC